MRYPISEGRKCFGYLTGGTFLDFCTSFRQQCLRSNAKNLRHVFEHQRASVLVTRAPGLVFVILAANLLPPRIHPANRPNRQAASNGMAEKSLTFPAPSNQESQIDIRHLWLLYVLMFFPCRRFCNQR